MKKLSLLLLASVLAASFALVGCQSDTGSEAEEPVAEEPVAEAPALEQPTADNPLVIDKENKQVRVYAEVNRKWVTEPTRHGVVTAAGSNGDKAIFKAGGDALEFHQALVDIGAAPGDNVKKDSPAGTAVEGSALDITVSWDDQEYAIADLVVASGELKDNGIAPKFGGNYDFQSEVKTGCLFCLDSCAAGITSNSAIGWKSFDSGKIEFRGNGDVLPADGTAVVITWTLQ